MTSLEKFPSLPPPGTLTICEVEGKVHSAPAEHANVEAYTSTVSILNIKKTVGVKKRIYMVLAGCIFISDCISSQDLHHKRSSSRSCFEERERSNFRSGIGFFCKKND